MGGRDAQLASFAIVGRPHNLLWSLLLLGCGGSTTGGHRAVPASGVPLEVRRALLAREVPVRIVLADALAAHGWLDESAPLAVVKRTRLFAADATIDTCYAEALVLHGEASTARPLSDTACEEAFALPLGSEETPSRPLTEEAYKRAHFTTTLPWRLLDTGTILTRRPDTVVAGLNRHLRFPGGRLVRQLLARYPADPEGEPTIHYFDAATGHHLGYLVRHAGGDALVVNDGRSGAQPVAPATHRTTFRLDDAGQVSFVRGEFSYRYPAGVSGVSVDRANFRRSLDE